MAITREAALQKATSFLEEAHIEEGKLDAWYLFEHALSIPRTEYFMNPHLELNQSQYNYYMDLVQLRSQRIPLQYITKEQEFMGLVFRVSPHVLIPRQDTEVLVEEVMKVAQDKEILDLCTGSGCIITSLAKLCALKRAVGSDISEEALSVARYNGDKHNVQVEYVQGDLFQSVTGTYDIIVSNPPYIPTRDIEELMPEVREHEPMLALDGKEDGLYFYRRIAKEGKQYLKPHGQLFLEIGYNQGQALTRILEEEGYVDIQVKQDLSGLDRVVSGNIEQQV